MYKSQVLLRIYLLGVLIIGGCHSRDMCAALSAIPNGSDVDSDGHPKGGDRVMGVDIDNWSLLRPGMTMDELEALVGLPERGLPVEDDPFGATELMLQYPSVHFDHPSLPGWPNMMIILDKATMTIDTVVDPFSKPLSASALAAPSLLCPEANASISYFPRYLDVRWRPCYAKAAVVYSVEVWKLEQAGWIALKTGKLPGSGATRVAVWTSTVPYAAGLLPMRGQYAWRVSACNSATGETAWSVWRRITARK